MTSTPAPILGSRALRLAMTAWFLAAGLAPASASPIESPEAAALRAAEEAFAAAATRRDAAAFAGWIAEDAVFAGGETISGRAAIVEAWAPFFSVDGPRISWSPDSVVVAPGGELGMTRGPWRIDSVGDDGEPVAREGTFFSVWRHGEEGWRIVLDSGTPGVPVPAPLRELFENLDWLVGSWRGPGLGGLCEETWSRPQGGAMLGMFRLIRDGKPAVYEILTIVPDGEGGLEMRLKHFGADLKGWEGQDEVVAFPFVSRTEGSLVFEGLAYHRDGDGLRAEVRLEKGEEPAVIRFTRVP